MIALFQLSHVPDVHNSDDQTDDARPELSRGNSAADEQETDNVESDVHDPTVRSVHGIPPFIDEGFIRHSPYQNSGS